MKKQLLILASVMALFIVSSCGGNNENKLNTQEEKAVEDQLKKDQEAMDSLEKAIQSQIDAVSEDTLIKGGMQ